MNPIQVAQRIREAIDKGDALGLAITIVRENEILYADGFGVTCVGEGGVPVTPDTVFAWGSISKTVCATVCMRLVERGLLDLDTPIQTYLPDMTFSDAERGRRVTLRHALSHTTGLACAGRYWGPKGPDAIQRFVHEELSQYEFIGEPGLFHQYNNTAIVLAGAAAEAATGKLYDDLVAEEMVEPLQMTRSTFELCVAMTYPVALPHEQDDEGRLRVTHRFPDNPSGHPAAFILGSTADLTHLAMMYVNDGRFRGETYLSETSIKTMHTMQGARYADAASHPWAQAYAGYGLGFMIGQYRDVPFVRHGGTNMSNQCFFDLFPDRKTGLVVQTNYSQDDGLSDLMFFLYDHLLNPPASIPAHAPDPPTARGEEYRAGWPRYEGVYLNVELGRLATISVEEDNLILEQNDGPVVLTQIDEKQFYSKIEFDELPWPIRIPVTFLTEQTDAAEYVMIGGQPYRRTTLRPISADGIDLSAYAGVYTDPLDQSPRLDLHFTIEDGVLTVSGKEGKNPCTFLSESECLCPSYGLAEFLFDDDARITGLKLGGATRYVKLVID